MQQFEPWPESVARGQGIGDRHAAVAVPRPIRAIDDEESLAAGVTPLPAEHIGDAAFGKALAPRRGMPCGPASIPNDAAKAVDQAHES
jgi:hypothetical protein